MSGGGDKKKLAARLTGDGSPDANTARGPSVVLANSDNAIPEFLREKPWAVKHLQNVLGQAYPDAKLRTFLVISLSLMSAAFLIACLISGNPLIAAGARCRSSGIIPFAFLVVHQTRPAPQQLINKQLPEAAPEFLSRVMRARPDSLSTGLQMMADELPQASQR